MFRWAMGLIMAALLGCGSADEGEGFGCITAPSEECSPLYEPVWNKVFAKLNSRCALGGGACHAADGNKGGLTLVDSDAAYEQLLKPSSGAPHVVPGDPDCSLLMVRLEADPSKSMPPGNPLSPEERCAVSQWIRAGAKK